jgi:hypothetical protein
MSLTRCGCVAILLAGGAGVRESQQMRRSDPRIRIWNNRVEEESGA